MHRRTTLCFACTFVALLASATFAATCARKQASPAPSARDASPVVDAAIAAVPTDAGAANLPPPSANDVPASETAETAGEAAALDAPSPAASLALAEEATPFLGGRLLVRLPGGASADSLREPAGPAAEIASTVLHPFGSEHRPLAIAAFDLLRLAGDDLAAQAAGYLERRPMERDKPRPVWTVKVLPAPASSLRVALAVPDRLVLSEAADDLLEFQDVEEAFARFAAAELFVAQADGMVQAIDLLCDEETCPRPELQKLAVELAATLAPGTVALARVAGPRAVGGNFRVTVPADFVVSGYQGIDYEGFALFRLVPLDAEPADRIDLYIAYSLPPRTQPLLAATTIPGRLLGRPIRWEVQTGESADGPRGLYHECEMREALFSWTLAAMTDEGVSSLRRIVETMEIVPSDYLTADTRCEPFDCPGGSFRDLYANDTRSPLNVRAEPSADAAVLGTLQAGTAVELAEVKAPWARLSKPIEGWAWAASIWGHCAE